MNGLPSWTMEGVDHAPLLFVCFASTSWCHVFLSSFPLWCDVNSLSQFGIDELQTLEQLTWKTACGPSCCTMRWWWWCVLICSSAHALACVCLKEPFCFARPQPPCAALLTLSFVFVVHLQPAASPPPQEAPVGPLAHAGRCGRPDEPRLQPTLQRAQTGRGLALFKIASAAR